jgi:hypothetical protein
VNLLSVAVGVLSSLFAVGTGGDARPATPPAPSAVAAPTVAQQLARIDELHKRRDDRAALAEEQALVQATLARVPKDFDVLWRAARYYFWISDDPGLAKEERSRLGKDGWDLAERAIAVNPNRVEGYYWAAVCMGNYALGLGVVKALSQGMEGKFRDRLGRAEKLDVSYQYGAIEVAWGRFFEKLPWPKRDREAAEQHLRHAIGLNGSNLRARVFLASVFLEQDRAAEAKKLLDEVAGVPQTPRYDGPEERRAKAMAAALMPQVLAKLK